MVWGKVVSPTTITPGSGATSSGLQELAQWTEVEEVARGSAQDLSNLASTVQDATDSAGTLTESLGQVNVKVRCVCAAPPLMCGMLLEAPAFDKCCRTTAHIMPPVDAGRYSIG